MNMILAKTNLVMSMAMANDWNTQSDSYKELKLNARGRPSDDESEEFLELLKKTQAQG